MTSAERRTGAPRRRSAGVEQALRGGGRFLPVLLGGSLLLLLILPLVALFQAAPPGSIVSAAENPALRSSLEFTLLASG
ncbi:MAG: hypothetical protein ACREC5_06730, partial [Thermoplasmata archaeon]